ncbi:MAG: hypothetical protein ACQ9ET_05905 [Nitrosomonadaceae bacterium]
MADPRTRLKSFTVKQCAGSGGQGGTTSQERKDFFSGLGKIGDLEFLNNSELGTDVGKGLRGLAKLSNSVRIGDGALPSSLGTAVDKGAGFVLDAVGIAPGVIETLKPLNPGVVNRALAQADAIWDDVKDGTYKLEDIPDTFSDLQNLERLARGIYTPPSVKETGPAVCEASPWAMDLDPFFPKYKFLFLVQFELNEPYNTIKNNQPNMFEFVIKNTSRPNINFEYEEINMYNFRTQVAKRTQYEPMTMRFYDDNINRIMQFYSIYLKAMSPIANQAFNQKMEGSDWYEQSGMAFDNQQTSPVQGINTNVYSGSLGPLEKNSDGTDLKTIISRVNLFHIYSMGRKANKYTFFNPRIQSMELDELDMAEGGAGSEISLQFNYDGMFLAPGMTIEDGGQVGSTNITDWENASGAQYPVHYEANGEFVKPEPEPGGAFPGEQVGNTAAIPFMGPLPNATSSVPAQTETTAQRLTREAGIQSDAVKGYLADARQQGNNAKTSIVNTVTDALDTVSDLFRGPRKL